MHRIYNFVRDYWQQLLLWEISDIQTEGEQHRFPGEPAPSQTLLWLPPPPAATFPKTSAGKASFL